MGRVTLRGLLAHKFRLVLTSVAIVLGVAFMSGTFVLTDTIGRVFDDLFGETTKGIDVVVRGRQPFESTSGPNAAETPRPPVPESVEPLVAGVPGVKVAEGFVQGYALVIGAKGENAGEAIQGQAPTFGMSWSRAPALRQAVHIDSPDRGPRTADEVALDEKTAEDAGVRRGDRVRIVFLQVPPKTYTVSGVFKFGRTGNLAGATLAMFAMPEAQRVTNRVGQFDSVEAATEPGVSERALRARVQRALDDQGLGKTYEAVTGTKVADENADLVKENISFFSRFILVFALVALFVGAFIIYNTFSIIVAGRTRELALLRAIGASGRQVMGSVAIEALAVGIVSSVLGMGLGVLVAQLIQALLRASGFEVPTGATQVATRTVVLSILVGVVVTLVAAVSPARRAARVSPMVALRDESRPPSSGWRRFAVGTVLTLAGVVALGIGLFGDVHSGTVPGGPAGLVGIAAFLVFIGVAMLSPLVARPIANLIGWPIARLRGMAGRLSRDNATRNPRRTASTASALMIGLALVSFVAILGASAKSTVARVIDTTVRAEFLLSGKSFSTISPEVAKEIRRELPGAEVTQFRLGLFQLEGDTRSLFGVSPNIDETIDVEPTPSRALDRFRSGGMLVYKTVAHDNGWKAGDTLRIRFPVGGPRDVPIAGIFNRRDAVGSNYLLDLATYESGYTDQGDAFVAVRKPPGVSLAEAQKVVKRVAKDFPNVDALNQAEFKQQQEDQFNQFLGLMYAMLGLAVLIALIGIANTLALSIFERTRELGLLRAVGMSRRQLRGMIRDEALIVAVFGSLLGLVIGTAFGRALVAALADEGVTFALPVGQLLFFLVLAGLFGVLAAWWPARRASRLDVLEAIEQL